MNLQKREMFWVAARVVAGLVLAYAGWSKLAEPAANFEAALLKYGIFSPFLISGIVRILPWLEWILGSFLILGYAPRAASAGAGGIFLCFLVVLTSSGLFLESGMSDCGCFGESGIRLTIYQIFFVDLAALVVTLRLAFMPSFPWSLHAFLLKQLGEEADTAKQRRGA